MNDDRCGTYAGYQVHGRRGERACTQCREAQRLYMKARRAKGGPQIALEAMKDRARERALWRLKDLHREDFDLLVADEFRAESMLARRNE